MKDTMELTVYAGKARRGDEAAFVGIVNLLKVRLYKIAIGNLHNEGLALEAVDETVFRAYKGIRKLKESKYVETWFIRILINVCRDMYNRSKKEEVVDILPEIPVTENFDEVQVEELLKALPEDLKQIISMKYFSDLTITEIAEVLELPSGTVKSRLNRALRLLRLEVENES